MFGILEINEKSEISSMWEETYATEGEAMKRVNECFYPRDEEIMNIRIVEIKPILKPLEPTEIFWTKI